MKLYISAVFQNKKVVCTSEQEKLEEFIDFSKLHILQSFAYASACDCEKFCLCKDFLMDSGAFTIMNSKSSRKNFDIVQFTKEYGAFVKKWNVKDFIELDVDSVFGMQTYINCLHMLQDITGRDPIRVMHTWRGKEYYEELTKKKDFVCLGGIAGTQNMNLARSNLQWFVDTAHKNNCKIHGLGIGTINLIRKYNFDSVDSANWCSAHRFGALLRFNGHELCKYNGSEGAGKNEHIATNFVARKSLKEWESFSHYIDLF